MGHSRLRLTYLLQRARRLKPTNLIEFAHQVKRVSRAPIPVIVADMLWCSVRYDMGFRDYAVWDIRILKARERRTWMTHPKSHRLTKLYNDPAHYHRLEDKVAFYGEFADVIGREWVDVRAVDAQTLADFVRRHERVIAKPADGLGGAGIDMYTSADAQDPEAFHALLMERGQTLVDEVLEQHPAMAALYPDSVNTLRAITYYDPESDEVHVIASVLRVGNGAVIDNFASGGMFSLLDDAGVAKYPGVDKHSNVYRHHPVTGAAIEGFQMPMYAELQDFIEKIARRVPELRYVGWDIALTPEGPALIEGNHNSSVFQPKPSATGERTGLLARYQEAMPG